jgi:hypothetical protein
VSDVFNKSRPTLLSSDFHGVTQLWTAICKRRGTHFRMFRTFSSYDHSHTLRVNDSNKSKLNSLINLKQI